MYNDANDLKNYIGDLYTKIQAISQQIKEGEKNIENWRQELERTISEFQGCAEELKQKMHNTYGGPSC